VKLATEKLLKEKMVFGYVLFVEKKEDLMIKKPIKLLDKNIKELL